MIKIKRGASFRVALKADSTEEWNMIYPMDYAVSQISFMQGDEEIKFDLDVTIDPVGRALYIRSETDSWPIGDGYFDVKTIIGDLIRIVPDLMNIKVTVLEGATS